MKKILLILALLTTIGYSQLMNSNVDSTKAIGHWRAHYFGGIYIKSMLIVPGQNAADSMDIAFSMYHPMDSTSLTTNRIRLKSTESISMTFGGNSVRYIWVKTYSASNWYKIIVLP